MKVAFLLLACICAINAQHVHEDQDWWENAVFYQVYPRSFKDSYNNDGIGDIRGIIEKLDYLKELGVDGFWMNPVFLSPMKDFGYDTQSFYEIQPEYGTEADMVELFTKAKALGIKVILDFVPNHTSDLHDWFIRSENNEAAFRDFYVWEAGKPLGIGIQPDVPNNWRSVFHQKAWTWSEKREMYYLHQFAKEQPDLNYRNPLVEIEMRKVIQYWLEKGADGFRVDAINHVFEVADFADEPLINPQGDPELYSNIDHRYTKDLQETYDMMYGWRQMMDAYTLSTDNVTRILMTETYANTSSVMKWYNDNGNKISHVPFNFIMIMDLNEQSTATDFKNGIDSWYENMPAGGKANWVLGNHDRPRIAQRYGEDRVDGLAIVSLLLPGLAFIYYGEEIGMIDNRDISWFDTQDPQGCNTNESVYQDYSRDPVRTPMQWDTSQNAGFSIAAKTWLPVHPNFREVNVQVQMTADKSTFKLYQELIKMRKEHTFSHGDYKSAVAATSVLSYVRYLEDEPSYVVLCNMDAVSRTVNVTQMYNDLTEEGTVMLASGKSTRKTGDKMMPDTIVLERYESLVIEFKSGAAMATMSAALVFFSVLRLFF